MACLSWPAVLPEMCISGKKIKEAATNRSELELHVKGRLCSPCATALALQRLFQDQSSRKKVCPYCNASILSEENRVCVPKLIDDFFFFGGIFFSSYFYVISYVYISRYLFLGVHNFIPAAFGKAVLLCLSLKAMSLHSELLTQFLWSYDISNSGTLVSYSNGASALNILR